MLETCLIILVCTKKRLTVWEAIPNARSRGNPAATPPSAKASIAKYKYAGPLPLYDLKAERYLSIFVNWGVNVHEYDSLQTSSIPQASNRVKVFLIRFPYLAN